MDIESIALSLLLFVLGVFVSHYYYRRGSKYRQICWAYNLRRFGEIPHIVADRVRLAAGNQRLNAPCLAHVYIWNGGNETVTDADIPDGHHLRIRPTNGAISMPSIVHVTNAANDVTIAATSQGTLDLKFGYLDPNDGVLIAMVLDPPDNNGVGIEVVGAIKGQGKLVGTGEYHWFEGTKGGYLRKLTHVTSLLFVGALTALLVYHSIATASFTNISTYSNLLVVLLGLVVTFALLTTLPATLAQRRLPAPPNALGQIRTWA